MTILITRKIDGNLAEMRTKGNIVSSQRQNLNLIFVSSVDFNIRLLAFVFIPRVSRGTPLHSSAASDGMSIMQAWRHRR